MDVATPTAAPQALAQLRRDLQGELEGLVEKRSGLARELEALDESIERIQRQVAVVEATEQLAAQERGQRSIEGGGPEAVAEVRGLGQTANRRCMYNSHEA
jgi:predicted  nucleic acid-binding Zn-ribbon protein